LLCLRELVFFWVEHGFVFAALLWAPWRLLGFLCLADPLHFDGPWLKPTLTWVAVRSWPGKTTGVPLA
jgi:hypothetical protein